MDPIFQKLLFIVNPVAKKAATLLSRPQEKLTHPQKKAIIAGLQTVSVYFEESKKKPKRKFKVKKEGKKKKNEENV